MTDIEDLLSAEGKAAERVDTPDDVVGEHRNLNRSVMFSIRLNPDELDELNRHAQQRGLPARTLARALLLGAMRGDDDLARRVEQLEHALYSPGS